MEAKRDFRVFTCIATGLFILVCTPLLWISLTATYPRAVRDAIKPLHFPAAVMGFIVVASLFFFIYNLVSLLKERKVWQSKGIVLAKFRFISPKASATFAGAIVYVLLWNVLGFSISSVLFMTFLSKIIEPERPLKQIVLVSFLCSLGIFLLFSFVFKVPFPEPVVNGIVDKLLY